MATVTTAPAGRIQLRRADALIIVDVQNDFVPGGNLAVRRGDEIVPVLNRYISAFHAAGLPVFATRDWHPADHCSFKAQGGSWPSHCVAGTPGAAFAGTLVLPPSVTIVSKATERDREAYSGFAGTELEAKLRKIGALQLFVGGLATDYCVLNTVRDARALGFGVMLLTDAIRAVDVRQGDGARAEAQMLELGARPMVFDRIEI